MAPKSRGKLARGPKTTGRPRESSKVSKMPSRKKTGTTSTQRHRFESFSQRVAKLNIDPLRRAQGRAYVHQQDEASHFCTAFEDWKDLNMSENFTSFVQFVQPMCHNLPQILHYQSQIMDYLVTYIRKGDALSLEPLLSLLVHFAHDLGAKFEAHFQSGVATVSQLAATHPDVEVLEWSFTSLAWLFKYLSRLLVPDLRPLYNLMAPLLGKEHQKSFVTRFAAEAMSFLVRKASSAYEKDPKSLETIIAHALGDLVATSREQKDQYQQGLIVLFAEAIKGIQEGVHTNGRTTCRALLSYLLQDPTRDLKDHNDIQYTVECILVDVIHHTDREGFAPILDAILDATAAPAVTCDDRSFCTAAHVLFVTIGTRKGSRIGEWSPILGRIIEYLQAANHESSAPTTLTLSYVTRTVAVAMQYAPLDVILPLSQDIMSIVTQERWDPCFLSFCVFFAEVGKERFDSLIMADLQSFVVSRWQKYESQICSLLPKFSTYGLKAASKVQLPKAWQQKILITFNSLASGDVDAFNNPQSLALAFCNIYIDLIEAFPSGFALHEPICSAIMKLIDMAVTESVMMQPGPGPTFATSKGLSFIMKFESVTDVKDVRWQNILQAAPSYGQQPSYLKGMLQLIQRCEPRVSLDTTGMSPLYETLVENLAAASHELRALSLEILAAACAVDNRNIPDGLAAALRLEYSPFTLETARSASLSVRALASAFEDLQLHPYLRRALPAYCFGLLHVRLASVWQDSCNALLSMINVKGNEDMIMDRAMTWLKEAPIIADGTSADQQSARQSYQISHPFQCSNLLHLEELAATSLCDDASIEQHLFGKFRLDNAVLPRQSLSNRSQALRVLRTMPKLAERRSRVLVPVLLEWALNDNESDAGHADFHASHESSDEAVLPQILLGSNWSRKDQKDLLELFSQFSNPSVLYRSKDVYTALLGLLCNGDVEIQKSALQALFAWDLPTVKPYKENLLNILDDARFREEVAVFLNIEEEDSKIRHEHRTDLMPILLRLLYGRIVTRSGSASTRGTQQAKRKAVLMSLARFGNEELSDFVNISLGPLDNLTIVDHDLLNARLLNEDLLPLRKQVGMLRMLGDTLEILGDIVTPFVARLLNAILYCLVRSSRQLLPQGKALVTDEPALENSSLLKSSRQEGLNALNLLFRCCANFDWAPYASTISNEFIKPRLAKLSIETAQAVSGLLRLFSTWSSSRYTAYLLVVPHPALLEAVADCLAEPSARDDVKLFVLHSIIHKVLDFAFGIETSENELGLTVEVLSHRLEHGLGQVLLERVSTMLREKPGKECLEAGIKTMTRLAPYATESFHVKNLLVTSLHLLNQPSRIINPRLKGEVLRLLKHFVPLYDFHEDTEFFDETLRGISSLFSYFLDGQNRQLLVILFAQLSKQDATLGEVAGLCEHLNSVSSTRLDEPDFEKRLKAFQVINDDKFKAFDARQWQPLVHNMLFLVRDNDELSIRTSASLSLRRFIQATCTDATQSPAFSKLVTDAVVPGIQSGMREASELVRAEYVAVLAELVKSDWPATVDMKALLGADDESSFFNNILHIQQHRRIRALRRLSSQTATMSSINIAKFCLPLIENFYADADAEAHNLAAEAITALDALAGGLDWQRFRTLLQRTINDASKLDSKLRIRALAAVVNALARAHKSRFSLGDSSETIRTGSDESSILSESLAKTLPDQEALSRSLSQSVLSKLTEQVHFKDESTVDLRVLISVIAVKVIMILPTEQIAATLPSVLMDVCNILRSKAQEARDTARKTLADISAIVGPSYFGFIIKQLRSSLSRGSQLHVLSYTIHSILVSISPTFKPGDVDYCLPELMAVIIDDILGSTGHEKEAQDYISRMKEVKKKNLSFDSMELLASITTLRHVSDLLRPIQEQLLKPKPRLEKIDELLRRLREGLRRNENAKDQDLLTLTYEILLDASKETNSLSGQLNLASCKMASFALELLRRVLDKYEVLKTPANLAGFMPMLRQIMDQDIEEVQICAMRLLTSIIKVPLPEIDESAKYYVRRAKQLIEASPSTNAPTAQAALRLVSAILRERPNANISKADFENNIAFLLTRIKPDLQEPARQGERDRQVAAFNFLKAVIGRKEPVAEAYAVMEVVREVMVTSQEHPIPDLARSVYSRFVLDYFPEEMKGFSKQLDFLVSNLQYPHPRGRLSVMEVIMFLLTRKNDVAVQPVLVAFFLPLLVVLATDAEEQCRESAQLLLRKVFERADRERIKTFKAQMMKWLDADTDTLWRRLGFQCWKVCFDVHTGANKEAKAVFPLTAALIESNIDAAEAGSAQMLHRALDLLTRLCEAFPAIAFAVGTAATWSAVTAHLGSDAEHVRFAAAHLIGLYFADFARTTAQANDSQTLPLVGSGGLELTTQKVSAVIRVSMRMLQDEADERIISQTVQNLGFLGRVSAGGGSQDVLDQLFRQASTVVRIEGDRGPPRSKLAALKLIAALCKLVPVEGIQPTLHEILLPLHNLTDNAIPSVSSAADPDFATVQDELVALAQEVLVQLQTKMGTSNFVAVMQGVQKEVRERREERRAKRRIEAVSAPEKAGREKQKKNESKRFKRREKNAVAAGRRRGW